MENKEQTAENLQDSPAFAKLPVSGSFSEAEVKWLVYYGRPDAKSNFRLDADEHHLDWAIEIMFDLLDKHTVIDSTAVKKLFWSRICALANCR